MTTHEDAHDSLVQSLVLRASISSISAMLSPPPSQPPVEWRFRQRSKHPGFTPLPVSVDRLDNRGCFVALHILFVHFKNLRADGHCSQLGSARGRLDSLSLLAAIAVPRNHCLRNQRSYGDRLTARIADSISRLLASRTIAAADFASRSSHCRITTTSGNETGSPLWESRFQRFRSHAQAATSCSTMLEPPCTFCSRRMTAAPTYHVPTAPPQVVGNERAPCVLQR